MLSGPQMNITVLGLWHLGSVTAACCAKHFQVVGLDFDPANIENLNQGKAPLHEPGLNELLTSGIKSGNLSFTTDPKAACAKADLLWVTYDTPVNDRDESDVGHVFANIHRALAYLPTTALVLISSQFPVGTCSQFEKEFPQFHFACSPENLRLGKAIESFEKAERVVVGIRPESTKPLIENLFAPFTSQILFMRTESAEMVKHALNSFLALSITFANEVARLGEHVGADAKEVSAGLKSDPRIGPRAYLAPGGPFAGGTLARDVVTLTKLGETNSETLFVIPAIKQSNDLHRDWAFRRLQSRLENLAGKTVGVIGLTYTVNTDTLRRSAAIELCSKILSAGGKVVAFDPAIKSLPQEHGAISLATNISMALQNTDAAVICTEWPQFRQADWSQIIPRMRQRIVIDSNGFLENELKNIAGVEHLSVGHVP
jgi:UDPglucose 6-dehydrogenase